MKSFNRRKGSHSKTPKEIREALKLELSGPKIERKHLLFLIFMSIAAVMVIVLAVVLLRSADKSRYEEYVTLAVESIEAEEYDNALRYLRKANEIQAADECLLMMADCYENLKNYDKALEMLRMLDTRDNAIASRISAIEDKKALLAEKETVRILGVEYPSDTTGLVLDSAGLQSSDLDAVTQLYALTNLSLADNFIDDISLIAELGGLTTLNLNGNQIKDLFPLTNLSGLRQLYLDGNPIEDFTPLYGLSNLSSLSIKGIQISETQLTELSNALPNCAIHSETAVEEAVDISVGGVTFKSNVTELDLSNLGISDITALSGCQGLKRLDLSGNEISDLYALMNLPELEWLDISENKISDLRPLMGLSTLRNIDASDNEISSTVPLGSMTALTHLDLENNPITDFSGFKKLRGLQVLSVKNTGLNDEGVACLAFLSSVQELNIEDNPDINGEAVDAMMARIGSCVLIHSKLVYSVDVDGHSVRTDAVELDLSAAGITDIASLGKLTNLEKLYLGRNTISNLYIFQYTDSRFTLNTLDLSNNSIEDITPIAWVVNLEYLDLSNNRINSILPLMNLTNLKELNISGNLLTEDQINTLQDNLINCEIHWQ